MARRNSRSVDESTVRLNGNTRYLGTIDAGTSGSTNGNCSASFRVSYPALLGKILLVQPDGICYAGSAFWTGYQLPASEGVKIAQDERVIITMDDIDSTQKAIGDYYAWLAITAASGTVNVKVWELV